MPGWACVVDDTSEPAKPDAVFPNNWVSFHRDGTIVLYPMLAPNRRAERRMEIVAAVEQRLGFRRTRLLDLSSHEQQGRMLEGTGSLVLDHVHRIAYACRSARTDESLVREWSALMNYEPLLFDALGAGGAPIYHTNVMLSIGSHWAWCAPRRSMRRIVPACCSDLAPVAARSSRLAARAWRGSRATSWSCAARMPGVWSARCWCCPSRHARRCSSSTIGPGTGSASASIG